MVDANEKIRQNLVTFLPGGTKSGSAERVFLKLESPFVLSAGIQPNINRAIVPYTEFEKLGSGSAFLDSGTIEFWFSGEPGGDPDHSIAGIRIVDVEPLEIRVPYGETQPRAVEYRLYLADAREQLMHPRGGWLTDGDLNFTNKPDATLFLISELIAKCSKALPLTVSDRMPADLDQVAPPRDIKWHGAHAPSELAKLLERVYATCCLQSDGSLSLERMGEGASPYFHEEDRIPDVVLPGRGRRGKYAIISGAPSPTVDTITLEGPSEDTWEYVAQDEKGNWKRLDEVVAAKYEVLRDFQGIADFSTRMRLRRQAYYYIRLTKKAVGGTGNPVFRNPILRYEFSRYTQYDYSKGVENVQRKLVDTGLKVMARCCFCDRFGVWQNASALQQVPILSAFQDPETGQLILQSTQRLVKVSRTSTEWYLVCQELEKGDLKVTFDFVVQRKNGQAEFFTAGYTREAQKLRKLSDAEVEALLRNKEPDVVMMQEASLRLRRVNGEAINEEELTQRAQSIADLYLPTVGDDMRIVVVRGLVAGQLSGKVSEIQWDQQALQTTFKVNGWAFPLQAIRDRESLVAALHLDEKTRSESDYQRDGMEVTGRRQSPVVMDSPEVPNAVAVRWGRVQEDWTGGNVVLLSPCSGPSDATLIPDQPTVIARILSPVRAEIENADLLQGDVVAYQPTGTNEGILCPVKHESSGTNAGMVVPEPTVADTYLRAFQGRVGKPGDANYKPAIIGWDYVVGANIT